MSTGSSLARDKVEENESSRVYRILKVMKTIGARAWTMDIVKIYTIWTFEKICFNIICPH